MFVRRFTTAAVAVAAAGALTGIGAPVAAAEGPPGSSELYSLFNAGVASGSGQGIITGSNAVTSGTAAILELPGVLCALGTMSGFGPYSVFCAPLKQA
ncbi:hypothetical protein [Nocardia sp. NPDC058666]|uniref:hypothetical protein n=1 Tax=unclassified Nocardia TaxID=2637762 RepID=UPI00364EA5A8